VSPWAPRPASNEAHRHQTLDGAGVGQYHRVGHDDEVGLAVAVDHAGAGRAALDAATQPGLAIRCSTGLGAGFDEAAPLEVDQRQRHRLAVDLGHVVEDRQDISFASGAVEQRVANHQVARQGVDGLQRLLQA
jgi:hypothetical protein